MDWLLSFETYLFIGLTSCCNGEHSLHGVPWNCQAVSARMVGQVEHTRYVLSSAVHRQRNDQISWLVVTFLYSKKLGCEGYVEGGCVNFVDQVPQVEDQLLLLPEQGQIVRHVLQNQRDVNDRAR